MTLNGFCNSLPYVHEHLNTAPVEFYYMWAFTTVCMVATIVLFAIRYRQHLIFGEKVRVLKGLVFHPKQTQLTVSILCLFPVLAIFSWAALISVRQAKLLDVLKHFYEMICLFWFWDLMVTILGGPEPALEVLVQRPPFKIYGVMPIICFRSCAKNRRFTRWDFLVTKFLVLQYAVCGPAVALIDAFTEMYVPYFHFVRMVSGFVCMWGVVIIFTASRIALQEFRVTLKFISVKCTVLIMNLLTLLIHQVSPGIDEIYNQDVMADAWTNLMYSIMTLLLMIIAYFGFPTVDIALREKRINGIEMAGVAYPKTPQYSAKSSTFAMQSSHITRMNQQIDNHHNINQRKSISLDLESNNSKSLPGHLQDLSPSIPKVPVSAAIRTPRHRLLLPSLILKKRTSDVELLSNDSVSTT
eukprot:Platyproteum_vivax@DN8361_c0_g1_i1.p1